MSIAFHAHPLRRNGAASHRSLVDAPKEDGSDPHVCNVSGDANGNGKYHLHLPVETLDEEVPAAAAPDAPAAAQVDLPAIEAAVRQILRAVGEDPSRPGLLETPRRVARMYQEMFAGLHLDPARHLRVTFPETYDEVVLVRDITFTSMCEHHLLPFSGVAHVAYVPNGRVTGLSKLARVVEEISRRPQVQERMTQQIADLMEQELGTAGVAVVIKAEHSCMGIRGVRKPGAWTVTSALRGLFKKDPSSRAEIMSLIHS